MAARNTRTTRVLYDLWFLRAGMCPCVHDWVQVLQDTSRSEHKSPAPQAERAAPAPGLKKWREQSYQQHQQLELSPFGSFAFPASQNLQRKLSGSKMVTWVWFSFLYQLSFSRFSQSFEATNSWSMAFDCSSILFTLPFIPLLQIAL